MSFTRPNWQKELLEKTSRFSNVPKWAIFGQFAMALARPSEKNGRFRGKLQSANRGDLELEIT